MGLSHGATFFYGVVLDNFEENRETFKPLNTVDEDWYWDYSSDQEGIDFLNENWGEAGNPVYLGQNDYYYFLYIKGTLHETEESGSPFWRVSFELPNTVTTNWDRLLMRQISKENCDYQNGECLRWKPKFHLAKNFYDQELNFTAVFYYGIELCGAIGLKEQESGEGPVQLGALEPSPYDWDSDETYSYLFIKETLHETYCQSGGGEDSTFLIPGVDTTEWDHLIEQKCKRYEIPYKLLKSSGDFTFHFLTWMEDG